MSDEPRYAWAIRASQLLQVAFETTCRQRGVTLERAAERHPGLRRWAGPVHAVGHVVPFAMGEDWLGTLIHLTADLDRFVERFLAGKTVRTDNLTPMILVSSGPYPRAIWILYADFEVEKSEESDCRIF